ncbi:hypothetical protein F4861DRAFT_534957 [Xylaria intraflava]|nr:hypothetical protein F4861DRAFT_534957 [Xylaria intraflava]
MALTIKHLNSDASFLLSFEPVIPESIADLVTPRPFTILLDPWITGPSTMIHPRISITSHKHPACVSSLSELPQPPDLVVISQHKPDHCNEATLRQLPPRGTGTLILAEPASARIIKSWKYFDKENIRTIERWEDPRLTGKQSVIRIPVPPLQRGGREGEVTVAFIPQKRDLTGLHGAIGITYRSPPTYDLVQQMPQAKSPTPPLTPESLPQESIDAKTKPTLTIPIPTGDSFLLPPTPPISPVSPISLISPGSLRSIRSASTLIASPTHTLYSPSFRPVTSSQNEKLLPPSPFSHSRPISLIFSPHGIPYSHLTSYVTSHLVSEAALPLTALLHCMDAIRNPWWLGGNICAGVPSGAEIASNLGARLWISAHDGEKDVRGLATGLLKTRRWDANEIQSALESGIDRLSTDKKKGQGTGSEKSRSTRKGETDILRLRCGEEILVSGTGRLWRTITNGDTTTSNTNVAVEPVAKPQQKHSRKTPGTIVLPKVQDAMSPKRLSTYKILGTKDLIMPSPKIVIEQEFSMEINAALPGSINQNQTPAESEKVAGTSGSENVIPGNSSDDPAVRFELSTT